MNHIALAGERLSALSRHRAGFGKTAEYLGPQIEGAQLVLAHQTPRQRAAHIAQSDITEFHPLIPSR
jgi:hypothetical protein